MPRRFLGILGDKMGSGHIRKGETEAFPVKSRTCWYALIKVIDGKLQSECYGGSDRDKKELTENIIKYLQENVEFRIYGVWQGQWRTDLFDLDPKTLEGKINEFFSQKESMT